MKRALILLTLVLSAYITASCTDDTNQDQDPGRNPESSTVDVTLSLKAKAMEARAIDEDSINDVNIFFYNDDDSRNYHFYFEKYTTPLTVQILPGTYELYVVANTHGDLGELAEGELLQYRYPAANMDTDIPMAAHTKAGIIANTTLPILQMQRAAAKIIYSISIDQASVDRIGLRSIQFCNIPDNMALWSEAASTSEEGFHNGELVVIDTPQAFSSACYLPENCQGDVESITNEEERIPENAPAHATYMRVLTDGADGEAEYIIYLGENRTSNFDVHANTCQKIDLLISADGNIEEAPKNYEGLYYGTANCHIASQSSVSFDATPYRTSKESRYIYTDVYAGKEYEAASADLLWEDVKGLITDVSFENNQVAVTTNGNQGNAVIALYDGQNNILWSFHIWATQQPGITTFASQNNGKNKYSMMDRELGGIEGIDRGAGLTYQHGRKDPFPAVIWSPSNATYKPIYLKNGDEVTSIHTVYPTDPDEIFGYCGSIAYSVAHPQDFFVVSSEYPEPQTNYGWVYPGTFEYNADLWGNPLSEYGEYPDNSQIQKSVYDPCPEGYKVAPNDALLTSKVEGVGIGTSENANPRLASRGIWGSGVGEYLNRLVMYKYTYGYRPNHAALEAGTIRCVKE